MKNSILKRRLARYTTVMGAAVLLGAVSTGCKDDLLTGQPSWLGQSIYDELEQRGNFTETLKLINAQKSYNKETGTYQAEDFASVLKKTGSKTLFVADDAAWAEFYKNNSWGVTKFEDLSEAQKNLLFKGNMVNSAYLVELLGDIPAASASSEPIEGSCMRRESSVSLMDSVPLVLAADFPVINPARKDSKTSAQIDWWSRVRGNASIHMMQDNNVPTMIHFMPRFMKSNNITSHDVSVLTNGKITSNTDAFVNGQKVTESDITCQNGYIHVMAGVPVQLDNMANIISQQPQFSIYKRLLDRFSYPHYDASVTEEYQRQYGGKDTVYVKRYFNSYTGDAGKFTQTDQNVTVSTQLPFDPGWNKYSLYAAGGQTTYQYDAAVMLVPTDSAMLAYLDVDGKDIRDRYAKGKEPSYVSDIAWDNAPDEVVLPLLQNTMLTSLKSAIPSTFSSINNTASEPMNVSENDITKYIWACNGVIYQTNKVYVAPEYVSVFYPCVIRAKDDLHMDYTVVTNDNKVTGGEGFYAYLNNMGSKYSFIIPTDNALEKYYDPVSYKRVDSKGASTALAYKFYINDAGYIAAYALDVDWTNCDEQGRGKIGDVNKSITISNATNSSGDAFNHFKDILNSSLAVGLFTPGQKFYQAKNGGPIVVRWDGDNITGVAGSFQYERGYYVPVTQRYDKSVEGNGRSYIIDEEPIMSTMTSPYAALTSQKDSAYFRTFANLMIDAEMFATNDGASHTTMDSCLQCLNNYHYTIYVPTNESIQELIDAHKLPTGEDIDAVRNCIEGAELDSADEAFLTEQKTVMMQTLQNFVNYHLQDNAVYIDGENQAGSVYESACLDTTTNRFVKLTVNYTLGGDLKVTDNCGNVRVVDKNGVNNILTRQYYFNGNTLKGNSCTQIYTSSYAVLHQIDKPLMSSSTCLYDPEVWAKVMKIVEDHPITSGVKAHKTLKRYKR